MNSFVSHSKNKRCTRRNLPVALAALIMGLALATASRAQIDNFDTADPATNAAWAKITSTNYITTYTRPTDEFGGRAIRLQGSTPEPVCCGGGGADPSTARVVMYRTDRIYTNFFVAVDIIAWDSASTNDLVFGLIAHATNVESGLLEAVTFTDRINRFRASEGSKGQTQIYGFTSGVVGLPAAQEIFTVLVPGRKYRFVFSAVGNVYTGSIYDLEDLTRPLVTMSGDDSLSINWFDPHPYPTSGYSGIFNVSLADGDNDPNTDSTFDNFVAAESAPTSVSAPATPHGLVGAPQVVNRTPISFANFHPASSGITFNATTLTTNSVNTNSIRLYLNGRDVSSGLSITGPTTNASVTYSGLASNVVYDARIELQDALGRRITNSWTFDTFSDAYLASAGVKNIECEDYDFTSNSISGQFIDAPVASGFTTNDTFYSTPLPPSGGYVDLEGTSGVDFLNPKRTTADPGNAYVQYNMFRTLDAAGTQQGNVNYLNSDHYELTFDVAPNHTYEVQRQKYLALTNAVQEYEVVQTSGGEWLNYTRVFSSSNYYNVYLRYGCGYSQNLSLDQMGAGPTTNNLGTFSATNYLRLNNYRYGALRDGTGKPVVVNLSGTNTLRLTVLGTDLNPTRYALAINYMSFVPALLLESAAQVSGPWSIETNASVELGNRRVTAPANGSKRFYRVKWDHQVTITSVKLVGGSVEMTYQ